MSLSTNELTEIATNLAPVGVQRIWSQYKTQRSTILFGSPVSPVYVTRMWGAALNSTTVAISVNRVKAIRHSLSSTMAAYFQSLTTSKVSSLARMVSVMILNTESQVFPHPG